MAGSTSAEGQAAFPPAVSLVLPDTRVFAATWHLSFLLLQPQATHPWDASSWITRRPKALAGRTVRSLANPRPGGLTLKSLEAAGRHPNSNPISDTLQVP